MSIEVKDVPLEVTLTDGSRWIVTYRVRFEHDALKYLGEGIREARLQPAEDLDGVQRRSAQINLAYVVSAREAERLADG